MNSQLEETLKLIPELPGCYLYHDNKDEIIYVGKAKNLKRRVHSYFNKKHDNPKTIVLVSQIERMEYIITDSEAEALILESHLIKKYKPKYNILLKDDKKFPYFLITDEEYPRITVVRKKNLNPEHGRYYGPYTDARAMYSTLDYLKKLFPLKQCKTPKFKNRPCLYYHIGRCLAPCQNMVTPEDYKKLVSQVELFLSGKQNELLEKLKEQMLIYSDNEQYEKAARLRDSYLDLEKTLERQKVVYENTKLNQDVISVSTEKGIFTIVILLIREGRLIDKRDFVYFDIEATIPEFFETFFREYYGSLKSEFPDKITSTHLEEIGNKSMYENWLKILGNKNIKITYAKTKNDKELTLLAKKNSDDVLKNAQIEKMSKIRDDFNQVGAYITEKLKLKNFPHRIECYDISHIQGTNTVSSMVVFENGISKKSAYKKFKIKSAEGKPDDFLSMQETLTRRFNRLGEKGWEKPDLIIIDGGKGQLSSVIEIAEKMNITGIDIVSLAKREEEVFLPKKSKSIILPKDSNALYLIQRIRDEAHRFAITFHRERRSKELKGMKTKL